MKWFPKSSEDVDVNAPCTLSLRAPGAEHPALAGFSTTYALSLTCMTRTSTKCICSQLPAQVFRLVLKTSRHRDTSTVNSTCTSHTLLPVSRKDGGRVEILAPNQFQPIAEVRPALLTYHQSLASQTLQDSTCPERIRRRLGKPQFLYARKTCHGYSKVHDSQNLKG